MLGDVASALAEIVAEAVGLRLEPSEGLDIGLLLCRVAAAGADSDGHVVPARLRCHFDGGRTTHNDEVSHRDRHAGARLDVFEDTKHTTEIVRPVDLPFVLRREAIRQCI